MATTSETKDTSEGATSSPGSSPSRDDASEDIEMIMVSGQEGEEDRVQTMSSTEVEESRKEQLCETGVSHEKGTKDEIPAVQSPATVVEQESMATGERIVVRLETDPAGRGATLCTVHVDRKEEKALPNYGGYRDTRSGMNLL